MTNINVVCEYVEGCTNAATHKAKTLCEKHYKREYRASRPEYVGAGRAYAKNYAQNRKSSLGDLYQVETRKNNLWVNYRMTVEDYDSMLESQGSLCAICDRHQSEFEKRFAVDHDHACCPGPKSCGECVRGLLCTNCNVAIGLLQDNADIVERAARYLQTNVFADGA